MINQLRVADEMSQENCLESSNNSRELGSDLKPFLMKTVKIGVDRFAYHLVYISLWPFE